VNWIEKLRKREYYGRHLWYAALALAFQFGQYPRFDA